MEQNENSKPRNPIMHASDGVSLRDYIDRRFEDNQRALDKAENTMAVRLAGMNEFRDTLRDQASKFITREEWSLKCDQLQTELKALRTIADKAEGKASQTAVLWTALASVIAIVLGLLNLLGGK